MAMMARVPSGKPRRQEVSQQKTDHRQQINQRRHTQQLFVSL